MSDDDKKLVKLVPKNGDGGETTEKILYIKFKDEDEYVAFPYKDWGMSMAGVRVLYLFDKANAASAAEPVLPTHGINLDEVQYWMADNDG